MQSTIDNANFVNKLIELVNQKYPNWEGFSDTRFEEDEVRYKQAAIQKARELLSKKDLDRLIHTEKNYDEVISRIERVGRSTNLLFQGVPMAGDLNVIYQESLNKQLFCLAFFDLIYGENPSTERLVRYSAYIQDNQLPNKWTFPTFFLCICHPESEMFVKPRTTQWFLHFAGITKPFPSSPNAEIYELVLNICKQLWNEFQTFHPRDFIDIQGLIWVAYQQGPGAPKLGKPFKQMFSDFEEAEWAFDLFQESMEVLGVKDESDPLIAINVFNEGKLNLLRFVYGSWLVLGFSGSGGKLKRINITLPSATVDFPVAEQGNFIVAAEEPAFTLYEISINDFKQHQEKILKLYFKGLPKIQSRFTHWNKSNFHNRQNTVTAQGVFDPNHRASILVAGVETSRGGGEGEQDLFDCYFTNQTFELFKEIHDNPTKDYYEENRDDFRIRVEEPFKSLLETVASKLPTIITDRLETRTNIVSRFLKNDFGQGGAWDFYWGAFYPMGSKRTADAQLALWMNKDRLEISFYIGDYGLTVRERFQRNARMYGDALKSSLTELIKDPKVTLERSMTHIIEQQTLLSQPVSWDEWLSNPQISNFGVRVILDKAEVLSKSKTDLEDLILRYFIQFYPLVLVSQEEDPIPMIEQFLGIEEVETERIYQPPYTIEHVSTMTGFTVDEIRHWVNAIHRKGQAILYGPPGTGKTFVAKELAKHLIAEQEGFTDIVQFHPAYSYEEFMQGIRPKARPDGGLDYPTVSGRFLEFCRNASQTEGICVLIIDEINRANLARVFGELMYLLEYRDEAIPLAGGGLFKIPKNVRVIGTMNTADRSIALVDHALRRRFAFLPLFPNYEVLRNFHKNNKTGFPVEALITVLKNLNANYIRNPHYEVGISYFMSKDLSSEIEDIWRMEIQPYLDEYFFDQIASAQEFRWEKLRDTFIGPQS